MRFRGMKFRRFYSYGVCESCKNCKHEKLGGYVTLFRCKKDKRYKRWCNKCHLYKAKRKYVRYDIVNHDFIEIMRGIK